MFRGSSFHQIDGKGRITIPDHFIEKIKYNQKEHVIMTITNEENCVFVYSYNEWNKLLKRVHEKKEAYKFEKYMKSIAIKCSIDDLDRIIIPHNFKEHAAIKNEIIISGMFDHFEIWSKEYWDLSQKELERKLEKNLAKLL